MQRLAGKVAIVTGGAKGMGAATVRLFVEHGARVVIGDIAEAEGRALAEELGDAAVFCPMDVTDEAHWENAINLAGALGPLNVLVNNAAILHMASIVDTTPEDYMRVVKINQLSAFLGIRAVIEPMKAAGGGSIINISSIDGLHSALMNSGGYRIYNLGGSTSTSLSELISSLEETFEKKAILERLPEQPGDVPRTFADISLAKDELGYDSRVSLTQGLRAFADWYLAERSGGHLP